MRRPRLVWFLTPITIAIVVGGLFVAMSPGPQRSEEGPPARAVRTMTVSPEAIKPIAHGWGNARAAKTWSAVAEVSGQIVYRHPGLETGQIISAGTTVLIVDPTDYELAIRQAEADIKALVAEANQLDLEEENTRQLLSLEEARLAISEKDLKRTRDLANRGAVPKVRVDEQERTALQMRRAVAELRNTLALISPRRQSLDAQTARTEAILHQAQRNLTQTKIVAPFDLRVRSVDVERFEYVNIGQLLVTGDDVAQAEVVAQIPFDAFLRLITSNAGGSWEALAELRKGPSAKLDAQLRLVSHPTQTWQGTVSRVEGALDPRARTVQVVVTVNDPYKDAAPPLRPALVPNMYFEVVLTGKALKPQIIVPESAVHTGNTVYVRNDEGVLEIRPVTIAFRQESRAVISNGLSTGETVVLDDLSPAIPGSRLTPVETLP